MQKGIPPENSRFVEFLEIAGLKQNTTAEIVGVTKSTISQIVNGRIGVSNQILKVLEQAYDLNPEWIRTGKGKMTVRSSNSSSFQPLTMTRIPILKEIPAGKIDKWRDTIPANLIEGYMDIPEVPGEKLFAVRVVDNSMEGRIKQGEIVIVAPNKVLKSVAVVRRPSGYVFRGIRRLGDEYRYKLIPLAPEYEEEEIVPDDETVLYVPIKVLSLRDF